MSVICVLKVSGAETICASFHSLMGRNRLSNIFFSQTSKLLGRMALTDLESPRVSLNTLHTPEFDLLFKGSVLPKTTNIAKDPGQLFILVVDTTPES